MLVATIILVAILTALIFTLTIVAFSSAVKTEKREIELGNRDEEIKEDIEREKKKSSKVLNWIGTIVGGLIAVTLLAASVSAVIYKAQGEQFSINNKVSLVIVTDSMDGFYDDEYKTELLTYKEDAAKDQFKAGDLLTFNKLDESEELRLYDVYGYKLSSGKIITHRLVEIKEDGRLVFRGDNAGGVDSYVNRSQVVLHYNDSKITYVGFFVLFSQSGFGLYSFISVIIVYVIAEIFVYKYEQLVKQRIEQLKCIEENDPGDETPITEMPTVEAQEEIIEQKPAVEEKPVLSEKPKTDVLRDDKQKVEFYTRQGQHIVFYKPKKNK